MTTDELRKRLEWALSADAHDPNYDEAIEIQNLAATRLLEALPVLEELVTFAEELDLKDGGHITLAQANQVSREAAMHLIEAHPALKKLVEG